MQSLLSENISLTGITDMYHHTALCSLSLFEDTQRWSNTTNDFYLRCTLQKKNSSNQLILQLLEMVTIAGAKVKLTMFTGKIYGNQCPSWALKSFQYSRESRESNMLYVHLTQHVDIRRRDKKARLSILLALLEPVL